MISCGLTRYSLYSVIAVVFSAIINGINLCALNVNQREFFNFIENVLKERSNKEPEYVSEYIPTSNPGWNYDERVIKINLIIYSAVFVGGIIGAFLSGYVTDRYGRKKCLVWNNSLVFLAVFFISFSKMSNSYEMLIIGQILIGINSGLNSCLGPIYLTEISPLRIRGRFGSVYILCSGLSILLIQILLLYIKITSWPTLFSAMIIPSILMLIILTKCPESPKYLFIINRDEISAQNVLTKLRENSEISDELYELKLELQSIERNLRFKFTALWNDPAIAKALFISLIVILSQQLTGIKAVLFFSTDIYETVGFDRNASSYMALTVTGYLTTLIFVLLVDKFGRRTLLLIGLLGMFCSLTFLTFCLALKESLYFTAFLAIISLYVFVIMFSCGPSFIPNFLFTELFRTDSRSVASSISIIALNSANLCFEIFFSPLQVITIQALHKLNL
jgi:SP family facilitated glucose transporter-like MFS transporter 1